MAAKAKSRGVINDTTPLMCTIEGIAKKEHVVSVFACGSFIIISYASLFKS